MQNSHTPVRSSVAAMASDMHRFSLARDDVGRLDAAFCARCGAVRTTVLHLRPPFPLWAAAFAAVGIGLLLPAVVMSAWAPGDAYDAMVTGQRPLFMRVLPVLVPCVILLAMHAAWAGYARSVKLVLPACGPCRNVARRSRRWCGLITMTAWGAAVLFFYIGGWPVAAPAVAHGLLLLPAFFVSYLVGRQVQLRVLGLTIGATDKSAVDVERGAGRFSRLDDVASASRSRRTNVAWILVVLVAAAAALMARSMEDLRIACPFGTLPLAYRHNENRVFGCISPDGHRHSLWTQAYDPQEPTWRGNFWFGQRDGEFAFFDARGGHLEAFFCRSAPCREWQYKDATGHVYRQEWYDRETRGQVVGDGCAFQNSPIEKGSPCLPYSLWP